MRDTFRQWFDFILTPFESGDEPYSMQPSHRTILLLMGYLFWLLATVSLVSAVMAADWFIALPFVLFFAIGIVCLVVGYLGNDRAVAKIWGNK